MKELVFIHFFKYLENGKSQDENCNNHFYRKLNSLSFLFETFFSAIYGF